MIIRQVLLHELPHLALLAEAAYVNFDNNFTDQQYIHQVLAAAGIGDKRNKLLRHQAEWLTTHWQITAQWPDNLVNWWQHYSGFSATLFTGKQGQGEVLAIRGSNDLRDWLSNSTLLDKGSAIEQVVDLYNFWQQLSTAKGESYQAATLSTKLLLRGKPQTYESVYQIEWRDSTRHYTHPQYHYGLGLEIKKVIVVGHSLGGHLAAAFSRLFPQATRAVLMINGVGSRYSQEMAELYRALQGQDEFYNASIINLVAEKGSYLIAQDTPMLRQPGRRLPIFVKEISFFNWFGHGTDLITDSTAILQLFTAIDPSLVQRSLTDVVHAFSATLSMAAADHVESFEYLVEALEKICYRQSQSTPIKRGQRAKLYQRISKLQSHLVRGKIMMLSESTPQQWAQLATTEPAYAYALLYLNPFAILDIDYSWANQQCQLAPYHEQWINVGVMDSQVESGWITQTYGCTPDYLLARGQLMQSFANYEDNSARISLPGWWDSQSGQTLGNTNNRLIYGFLARDDMAISHKKKLTNRYNEPLRIYIARQPVEIALESLSQAIGYLEILSITPSSVWLRRGHYRVIIPQYTDGSSKLHNVSHRLGIGRIPPTVTIELHEKSAVTLPAVYDQGFMFKHLAVREFDSIDSLKQQYDITLTAQLVALHRDRYRLIVRSPNTTLFCDNVTMNNIYQQPTANNHYYFKYCNLLLKLAANTLAGDGKKPIATDIPVS